MAADKTEYRIAFLPQLGRVQVPTGMSDEDVISAVSEADNASKGEVVLSRICAAPSARLGHVTFECQGALRSQC